MPSTSQPLQQVECRICGTHLSLAALGRDGRFRCPKCLHVGSWPARAAVMPVVAASRETPAASPIAAGALRDLQAEIQRLRQERDALAARLDAATAALRDAAAAVGHLAHLEERLAELAGRCVSSTLRVVELEQQLAAVRAGRRL